LLVVNINSFCRHGRTDLLKIYCKEVGKKFN